MNIIKKIVRCVIVVFGWLFAMPSMLIALLVVSNTLLPPYREPRLVTLPQMLFIFLVILCITLAVAFALAKHKWRAEAIGITAAGVLFCAYEVLVMFGVVSFGVRMIE
jgi:hypothetical protein